MASKLLFFWQFLRNAGRNHIIKKLKQPLSFSPVYFHFKQQQDFKIKMLSSNNEMALNLLRAKWSKDRELRNEVDFDLKSRSIM